MPSGCTRPVAVVGAQRAAGGLLGDLVRNGPRNTVMTVVENAEFAQS